MPYDNTVYLWNSKYKMQYSMKYQTWSLHMPLNVSFIIQFLSLSRYLIVNLVNGLLTIFTQLITNMKHSSYYNIHRIISRIYISYVLVCLCTTWAHVEQLYFYYFSHACSGIMYHILKFNIQTNILCSQTILYILDTQINQLIHSLKYLKF